MPWQPCQGIVDLYRPPRTTGDSMTTSTHTIYRNGDISTIGVVKHVESILRGIADGLDELGQDSVPEGVTLDDKRTFAEWIIARALSGHVHGRHADRAVVGALAAYYADMIYACHERGQVIDAATFRFYADYLKRDATNG